MSTAFPASIHDQRDVDAALRIAYERDASDVYLESNETLDARSSGHFIRLSDRRIRQHELTRWVTIVYDENPSGVARVREGHPIDFSYECRERVGDERLRWRVNASAHLKEGQTDVRVVMRRISSQPPSVESLGTPAALVETSDNLMRGMMVVTGPTGSGKSTTLSALLRHRLENPDDHIHMITLESPIEYVYDDIALVNSKITQIEVGRHLATFERGVENALRQDPDVILVGETRDRETARSVLLAAQTGHGVYTTLHTNGVTKTMVRLLEVFPAKERVMAKESLIDSVSIILSQRLLRRKGGGRVAAFEYLVFSDEIKQQLRAADSMSASLEGALARHGQPMERCVTELLESGKIERETHDMFLRQWNAEAKAVGGV